MGFIAFFRTIGLIDPEVAVVPYVLQRWLLSVSGGKGLAESYYYRRERLRGQEHADFADPSRLPSVFAWQDGSKSGRRELPSDGSA